MKCNWLQAYYLDGYLIDWPNKFDSFTEAEQCYIEVQFDKEPEQNVFLWLSYLSCDKVGWNTGSRNIHFKDGAWRYKTKP